jgi:hypothetical protein
LAVFNKQGVMPMRDDTPYIIVDNRKIPPIQRPARTGSASAVRPRGEEQPFGVVDRVTISREAREKARHPAAHAGADSPALDDLSKKPSTSNRPQLTDSREKRP